MRTRPVLRALIKQFKQNGVLIEPQNNELVLAIDGVGLPAGEAECLSSPDAPDSIKTLKAGQTYELFADPSISVSKNLVFVEAHPLLYAAATYITFPHILRAGNPFPLSLKVHMAASLKLKDLPYLASLHLTFVRGGGLDD